MKQSKAELFAVLALLGLVYFAMASEHSSAGADEVALDHDDTENVTHGGGHGNDTDHDSSHHGEHHGIHVVSINFDYVKQPLVVTLFMLAVVLCKIGKYT